MSYEQPPTTMHFSFRTVRSTDSFVSLLKAYLNVIFIFSLQNTYLSIAPYEGKYMRAYKHRKLQMKYQIRRRKTTLVNGKSLKEFCFAFHVRAILYTSLRYAISIL